MDTHKRKLSADTSGMDLDNDSQLNDTVNTPRTMGILPKLPPPSASMKQFVRDIRVVDPAPNSSVFVDNPSPPAFKRQKLNEKMELTKIQDSVAISTPFKRVDFDFEVPQISSRALDTSALDEAFAADDDADQTAEIQVYVDPENEPPQAAPPVSPIRKPLAAKQLSPVQEATQESSEIQNVITAPIVPLPQQLQQQQARSPSPPHRPAYASRTAPIRSLPATPRYHQTPRHRSMSRTPSRNRHRNTNGGLASQTPSRPHPHLPPSVQATPTRRVTPTHGTPLNHQQVILIPSSPDRAGSPMIKGSFRSDDESFMNLDPDQLDSVDDLMVHLAIKDFNPTPIDDILPEQEIKLVGLTPEQEITALTLQSEIDRLIQDGHALELEMKKHAENMNVNGILSRYSTYNRQQRVQLKHKIRSLYDHLQAKAELASSENELEMFRTILGQLKDLKKHYDAKHAEFNAIRQESKVVEGEIEKLRNLQNDEAVLEREIATLKAEVDGKFHALTLRQQEVTNRTVENEQHAKIWSKHQIKDVTKEDSNDAWFRRQFQAKLETIKTLHGVLDIKFLVDGQFTVTINGLEILGQSPNRELKFKLLTSNLLSQQFFDSLGKYKTLKENILIWKDYLLINKHIKQLRRLGFNEWSESANGLLVFKLVSGRGTVHIQFMKGKPKIEWCELQDKQLQDQVLRAAGINAVAVLASKL